jgi:hypothetical protein
MKSNIPAQGEIRVTAKQYLKNALKSFKKFLLLNHQANFSRIWYKSSFIQNCSNKGSCPFQRGGNYKKVKIGWGHSKIFSSRTKRSEELSRFTWKLIDIVQIQVC